VILLGLVERDRRKDYIREPGKKRNFFGYLEELLIRWMIHSSGLTREADSSRSGPAGHALYHSWKGKQREIVDHCQRETDKVLYSRLLPDESGPPWL